MEYLIKLAKAESIIRNQSDITQMNSKEIYTASYPDLIQQLYGDKAPGRPADLNINIVANRMKSN